MADKGKKGEKARGEKTTPKQLPQQLAENMWKPGQSGNPAGRPKGSRNKLGEALVQALYADFQEHGPQAIRKVREDRPQDYLKVVASILPKQFEIKDGAFEGIDDDQLAALVAAARSALGVAQGSGNRDAEPDGAEPSGGVSPLH